MTKQETSGILTVLRAAYPRFYVDFSKQDLTAILNLWAEMFATYDEKVVRYAVKELILEHKQFPPTIADVNDRVQRVYRAALPPEDDVNDLWAKIVKAAENSGYEAYTEFKKLPRVCQRFVGSPETLKTYGRMDTDKLETVVRSNFLRVAQTIMDSENESKQMPDAIRQLCNAVYQPLDTPESERLPFKLEFENMKPRENHETN